NTLGGLDAADRNLVSGNSGSGIELENGSGNRVQGNLVGTNRSGAATLPNGANGVLIVSSAGNTIGGAAAGAGNVLSGNGTNGVTLVLAASSGNVIQGNYIGTDVAGTHDLGNLFFGVFAFQAPGTVIGGAAAGAGNLISGNNQHGIFLQTDASDAQI